MFDVCFIYLATQFFLYSLTYVKNIINSFFHYDLYLPLSWRWFPGSKITSKDILIYLSIYGDYFIRYWLYVKMSLDVILLGITFKIKINTTHNEKKYILLSLTYVVDHNKWVTIYCDVDARPSAPNILTGRKPSGRARKKKIARAASRYCYISRHY